MSREYTTDVAAALKCPHTIAAIEAYAAIRRSIVITDDMSEGALIALRERVVRASKKYSTEGSDEARSIAAFNKMLEAYVTFLNTLIWERSQ